MPPVGDGFYYFSVFLTGYGDEESYFDVELNGELICTVFSDLTDSPSTDREITSCSSVSHAVEGSLSGISISDPVHIDIIQL